MAKSKKVWTDPSPYGTYKGERGNPDNWRSAFDDVSGRSSKVIDIESPWNILGISPNASIKDIKQAYRKLCQVWHPDKNIGKEQECAEKFKQINEAYKTLIKTFVS